jgi:hypothetical protein
MDFLLDLEAGFLPRLGIDLACMFVLIRGIYYRTYRRADLFLTFFAFNLVIFLIAFVLNSATLSMGAAFGLFAVFSMLRYRTEGISTIDMTYLFLGIALGLIMAIGQTGLGPLFVVGAVVLVFTQILEGGWLARRELRQLVHYDRIDLVNAHEREALLADLRGRTGLNVHRVEVQEIDLLRDSAMLQVYYYANDELAPAVARGQDMRMREGRIRPG